MKKLLLIPFLLILLLASCKQEYNILEYQENDVLANCTVNGKYNVNIIKCNDFLRLEILAPTNLKGISFKLTENDAYAIKDEIKIPLDKNSLRGICALLNCFSLTEEAITSVNQNNVITFDTDYGLYTVAYGKNNLPEHIAIASDTYDYSIVVNSISLRAYE